MTGIAAISGVSTSVQRMLPHQGAADIGDRAGQLPVIAGFAAHGALAASSARPGTRRRARARDLRCRCGPGIPWCAHRCRPRPPCRRAAPSPPRSGWPPASICPLRVSTAGKTSTNSSKSARVREPVSPEKTWFTLNSSLRSVRYASSDGKSVARGAASGYGRAPRCRRRRCADGFRWRCGSLLPRSGRNRDGGAGAPRRRWSRDR